MAKLLRIRPQEIEKAFLQAALDLKCVLVIDEIKFLPESSSWRIRCHDMQGTLPDLIVREMAARFETLEKIGNRACWLSAISGIRRDLASLLPRAEFLLPTTVDGKAVVGMKLGPRTFLAEDETLLEGYHALKSQVFAMR